MKTKRSNKLTIACSNMLKITICPFALLLFLALQISNSFSQNQNTTSGYQARYYKTTQTFATTNINGTQAVFNSATITSTFAIPAFTFATTTSTGIIPAKHFIVPVKPGVVPVKHIIVPVNNFVTPVNNFVAKEETGFANIKFINKE